MATVLRSQALFVRFTVRHPQLRHLLIIIIIGTDKK